jgi:hypothetical protein
VILAIDSDAMIARNVNLAMTGIPLLECVGVYLVSSVAVCTQGAHLARQLCLDVASDVGA